MHRIPGTFRRILSALTSAALGVTAMAGTGLAASTVKAAETNWKFDLGGSGAAGGYTGVSASDGYNASRGYGFSGSVANIGSSGKGANADAVSFTGGTFNVDLPKGLYQVTVTTGDSPRTSIQIEGMLQMINLTGNNAVESIQVPVTDGQLNIAAVAGMKNAKYTIAAVEITQLNTTGEMKPTVWICGDSTVANYYNTADTAQHGWGQYLKNYINTNVFEVRNQASSGQYAKGFVDGGQFDAVKTYGKAGDYYVISIGINDTNYSNRDEYYSVVTDMVKTAKGKGMNVILVKQQGRHGDLNRSPLLGGRWFGGQLDQIGSEQNVTVIDDFTAWQEFGVSIGGYDAMTEYYAANDDLHQSAKGAQKNAEIIAGLMKIGDTEMDTEAYYTFKNVNSGLVMEVKDASMTEGANIQQWDSNGHNCQKWKLTPFSGGTTYYYVRSAENPDYVLKAVSGDNGGNVELVPYAGNDSAMLFQFTRIGDGSYYISTRASRDARFVEVASASSEKGANIQQWDFTYSKCQVWQAEKVSYTPSTPEPPTEPVTEPITEPTTAAPTDPPPADKGIMGDLNSDGAVDVIDLGLLKRAVTEGKAAAAVRVGDLNGDNVLDAADIALLTRFLHGDKVTFAPMGDSKYYAVDQTWDQGVAETVNAGYTKPEGYVNLDNNDTSSITFAVQAASSGNYMTHIRFANGTTDDRAMKVIVNGDTNTYWMQSFPGTGAWTDWTEIGIVLPLKAGANTIQLVSTLAGKGGPNLDYIDLTLTDEPIAETYDPTVIPPAPTPDLQPVLYLAGDSTCMYYSASKQSQNGGPIQGWGYYLPDYFGDGVTIYNHAIAGRSSKKFYDESRCKTITDSLKEGDYVMIQFAINDAGKANADRYAPVCGNVNTPAEGSYEWYMTSFIKDTLAKGATPILMSCTLSAKSYANGKFSPSYGDYTNACKGLAAKYNVPFIDCNGIMANHYNSVGYDTAVSYHMAGAVAGSSDYTHFNEGGAKVIAGLVAQAVKDQKIAGLSGYVK